MKLGINYKRITNFWSPCIRCGQFFKMVFIVVLFFVYITLIFILNLTSFFSSEKFQLQFCFQRRWWYLGIYFFNACTRIYCCCYTDCSREIKRCLLLGRKVMTNLDSIFKSRDITLPTKVPLVKAMVFPVVMYGCESCTVKKAKHWELLLLNCGVGEDSWESLGLQGDPTSPFWRRSVLGFLWRE